MKLVKKCKLLVELWLLISISAILTACGDSEKSEKEMMEDLNSSELVKEYYLDEYSYTLTDLEIIKRNTVSQETDDVFATFVMANDWKEVHGQVELLYNYYSTGGWILDAFEISWDSVYYIPLQECESWLIEQDLLYYDIDGFTVVGKEVDLENGIEILTVDASDPGELLSRVGTVTAEYLFSAEIGTWQLLNIYGNDDFGYVWEGWGTYANTSKYATYANMAVLYYFYEGNNGEVLCQKFDYESGDFWNPVYYDYTWKDKEVVIDLNTFTISIEGVSLAFDKDNFYSGGDAYVKISNGRASAHEWANVRGIPYNEYSITAEGEQGDPLLYDESTVADVFEDW